MSQDASQIKLSVPVIAGAVGIALVVLVAAAFALGLLDSLELNAYDYRLNLRGPLPPNPDILLVTIDPTTVKDLGRKTTEITRAEHALVLSEILKRGAALAVYDIDFSSPSIEEKKEDDFAFQQVLVDHPGRVIMSRYVSDGQWMRPQEMFREAVVGAATWPIAADADSTGSISVKWNDGGEVKVDGYTVFTGDTAISDPYAEGVKEFGGLPGNVNNAKLSGFTPGSKVHVLVVGFGHESLLAGEGAINEIEDADDRIRRKPLLVTTVTDPEPAATLSLAAAIAKLWPADPPAPCPAQKGDFCLEGGGEKLDIPLENGNYLLINYAGPRGTFPRVSFSKVLLAAQIGSHEDHEGHDHGEAPALPDLKDKIVLIGNTHPAAHDEYPTPFPGQGGEETGKFGYTSGLEIHANALQTLLDKNFITRMQRGQSLALTLSAGILFVLVLLKARAFSMKGGLALVLFIAGLSGWAYYSFTARNLMVTITPPLLAAAFSYVGVLAVQTVGEYREKLFLKSAFSMYLAPTVIDAIMKDPDKLDLGGDERNMTAMFSDIQGFSTISEKLRAPELVHLLNEYLTPMCDAIFKYEGTVDKFEGDAIIAFFGAPIPHPDHALRACRTALEMRKLNQSLNQRLQAEGRPELITRIGLNTGTMVVGNMGSAQRMDYTIMGDAVNLASRLEGANKQYGSLLMISEFTYAEVKDQVEVRELDLLTVVGKAQPVRVYELLAEKGGLDDTMKKVAAEFSRGLGLYRAMQWDEAIAAFDQCQSLRGEDPPSRVFIGRCKEFKANPPPAGWDGVCRLKSK